MRKPKPTEIKELLKVTRKGNGKPEIKLKSLDPCSGFSSSFLDIGWDATPSGPGVLAHSWTEICQWAA